MAMATEKQALVSSALQKLELKPKDSEVVGGPQELEVTAATLKYLENKTVTVKSDGSVEVSG